MAVGSTGLRNTGHGHWSLATYDRDSFCNHATLTSDLLTYGLTHTERLL